MANIFDIRLFLGFYVSVDTYRFKGSKKQCYNCQRINHSSATCGFNPVCLKGAANCKTKDYTISRKKDLFAYCLGNHTANYSKYLKIPKMLNLKKSLP